MFEEKHYSDVGLLATRRTLLPLNYAELKHQTTTVSAQTRHHDISTSTTTPKTSTRTSTSEADFVDEDDNNDDGDESDASDNSKYSLPDVSTTTLPSTRAYIKHAGLSSSNRTNSKMRNGATALVDYRMPYLYYYYDYRRLATLVPLLLLPSAIF